MTSAISITDSQQQDEMNIFNYMNMQQNSSGQDFMVVEVDDYNDYPELNEEVALYDHKLPIEVKFEILI